MLKHNQIYCMDALEGLRRIASDSVDLVITDPPYNIASANRKTMQSRRIVSTVDAWGAWDQHHPFDFDLLILTVISQCYRVLKKGGSMYLFSSREDNGYFIRKAVSRGFVYRNQLALIKKNPLPSFGKANWRSAFELCMYVTKGKPSTFNFLSQQECINVFSRASGDKVTRHPTEKPITFIKQLVKVSSNPNDLVLDPFMGSGTTAVACKQLGRNFLGFERSREYVKMARARLRNRGGP